MSKKRVRRDENVEADEVEDEEVKLHARVQRAKFNLWRQLNGPLQSSDSYLRPVEEELRSRLDAGFAQGSSSSLMVIGPNGSGKMSLVEKVLATYRGPNNSPCLVAKIRGQVCASDQQAILSIVDQFCYRGTTNKNLNLANEDLENHFKVERVRGRWCLLGFKLILYDFRLTCICFIV